MGVIYKLKEEVVQFIISQRQGNPLFSCRQLAESASLKFGLQLSKSAVHDVLKGSGIITPRGRKPKPKFEIPQEKKKQIQSSLSQVKLLSPPADLLSENNSIIISSAVSSSLSTVSPSSPTVITPSSTVIPAKAGIQNRINSDLAPPFHGDDNKREGMEISPEYENAGKIFLKAARWDLGIFSEENVKDLDWKYFLTYSKGVNVFLENNKSFFIDLPLPIERCIREVTDGLINNVRLFIVHKVSDEVLFKSCMDAQTGFKIDKVLIVGQNDHIIFEFNNIVEFNRKFIFNKIVFMGSKEIDFVKRSMLLFFPQLIDNNTVTDNILNIKGFYAKNRYENNVTLIVDDSYENIIILREAVERLNGMYLRDEQDRLVKVLIRHPDFFASQG